MKVGFIGLGNMGQGMAENLLSKGVSLLCSFIISKNFIPNNVNNHLIFHLYV